MLSPFSIDGDSRYCSSLFPMNWTTWWVPYRSAAPKGKMAGGCAISENVHQQDGQTIRDDGADWWAGIILFPLRNGRTYSGLPISISLSAHYRLPPGLVVTVSRPHGPPRFSSNQIGPEMTAMAGLNNEAWPRETRPFTGLGISCFSLFSP